MPRQKPSPALKQHAHLHDNTPSPVQPLSLRKLLLSHTSIYNVLTNPDLDGLISTLPASQSHPHTLGRSLGAAVNSTGDKGIHGSVQKLPVSLSLAENSPKIPTDPLFSVTSWQSVGDFHNLTNEVVSHLSSPMKRFSLSILLLVSDDDIPRSNVQLEQHEDCGSTIVVPYPKKVMIFETDEEEEDEDTTMICGTSVLTRKISPLVPSPIVSLDSFIMPRMTVSSMPQLKDKKTKRAKTSPTKPGIKGSRFVLILSAELAAEAKTFAEFISSVRHINMEHLVLKSAESLDENFTRSRCIFIINDGNPLFLQKLSAAFVTQSRDSDICTPKITLINMITANYFVNLFELINLLNPYQIWKTHSLKHDSLLRKLEDFLDCELTTDPCKDDKSSSLSLISLEDYSARKKACQEAFSSVIVPKNSTKRITNYKQMEKKFKKELTTSLSTLDHSDPLQISTRFSSFNLMTSVMGGVKEALIFEVDGKMMAFFTFAAGIGVGIGVANGSFTVLSEYVKLSKLILSAKLACKETSESTKQTEYMNVGKENGVSTISKAIEVIIPSAAIESFNYMSCFLEELAISSLMELNKLMMSQMDTLRSLNSFLIQYLKGGFEKALGLMLCFNV